jgi:peptide/nickel transport system substrate-binding protein
VQPENETLRGGTLRIAAPGLAPALRDPAFLDPQRPFDALSFEPELFRCCLVRTLYSYSGRATEEGGTVPRPDLAAAMPQVSRDGLTWTIRLKPGIRYAPPLEDVEITAADVVRAIERAATADVGAGAYQAFFGVIQGYGGYASGEADTISGLEVLGPHTLRVDLSETTNDLAYRLAMPASAPIPPSPADPAAAFGTAYGHGDGYGPYLVASGPYMLEGADRLDPSLPPADQPGTSGLEPRKVTLIRNPSWDPHTDELRAAYVDRIEVRPIPFDEAERAIGKNRIDLSTANASSEEVARYLGDPDLVGRVYQGPYGLFVGYAAMNLGVAPFDDVHVRRAVNLAYDAERWVEISNRGSYETGEFPFRAFRHIAPDSFEANLLRGSDPYPFDLDAAREEMALSSYDRDGDGVCDDPSCHHVFALDTDVGPEPRTERVWIDGLKRIGIMLEIRRVPERHPRVHRFLELSANPTRRIALNLGTYWFGEFPVPGSRFFQPQFQADGIGATPYGNVSLIGARSDQLEAWGYDVTVVPDVDAKIGECLVLTGFAETRCWAELDQFLMTKVVPWIPQSILWAQSIVSDRVVRFSLDPAFGWPAPDQIALASGSA